jgi:two-component system, cell cycle response regulator DivK
VLIVEDHAETREMYGEYLRASGLTVYEAADGRAGVEEAPRLRPDVILMDLAMPGLTGWEATRRLRHDETLARLPVIAITAYGGLGFEFLAAEAGCDRLLTKPCRPRRVLEEIEDVLSPRRKPD